MKINMSKPDRIIRFLVGVVLAILYFTNVISGTLGTVFLIVAAVMLFTSTGGFCPLYALLGVSTKK